MEHSKYDEFAWNLLLLVELMQNPVLDRIGRAAVRRRDFGKASGKDNKETEKAVKGERQRVLLRDI